MEITLQNAWIAGAGAVLIFFAGYFADPLLALIKLLLIPRVWVNMFKAFRRYIKQKLCRHPVLDLHSKHGYKETILIFDLVVCRKCEKKFSLQLEVSPERSGIKL